MYANLNKTNSILGRGYIAKMIVYGGLFILAAIVVTPGWISDYSIGERSGVITKFSNKGVVLKSWEGEMLQGGMRLKKDQEGRDHLTPNIFTFSVIDESITKKLNAAINKGGAVTVKYKQWLMKPIYIDTSYVIVDVLE